MRSRGCLCAYIKTRRCVKIVEILTHLPYLLVIFLSWPLKPDVFCVAGYLTDCFVKVKTVFASSSFRFIITGVST